MIQLNNVQLAIKGNLILSALNLNFETNINYLINGRNGVGKTMLLKLLAGKILPVNGSLTYNFIDDALDWQIKYELRKKYIHYIPVQAIHDLISSHEMYYQQRYYTIESTKIVTVRDYLGDHIDKLQNLQLPDSFQINLLFNVELTRLSNGQVKKVVILKRLLDSMPRILLLDYPFEGLDAKSRSALSDFLDHISEIYHIQLIIADHEHPQLPKTLSKKITLEKSAIIISDLKYDQILESTVPKIDFQPALKDRSEPVVEMRSLKIQYGNNVIIDNLNWRINRGERWALTGRNGSGKTTLFSLIYADHPVAYSQEVFLFGRRRGTGESIWDIKKRISYLGPELLHFLDYATQQLTVHEYLQKNRASSEKLYQLISWFEIQEISSKQLQQLSNGQLQLVLLIALFLAQKELLLLDEPFQFLDPDQKRRVNEYLLSHLDDSTTLILITHYESDVSMWTHQRLDLKQECNTNSSE